LAETSGRLPGTNPSGTARSGGRTALTTCIHGLTGITWCTEGFGTSHASGAFVQSSLIIVVLSILNAFLFGWVAAETALLTKNILPLMMFHCLFDFFTYQVLATGNALILIYAVRGSLMTAVAVYLLYRLKHHSGDNVAGRSSRRLGAASARAIPI